MNPSLLLHPALAPALLSEGSTRPFVLPWCARLAQAALALLLPDLAIAAGLALAAWRRWLPAVARAAPSWRLAARRRLYA